MGKSDLQPAELRDFWYWVNERHTIHILKNAEQPWPWTQDPILQEYKFTNVFRELDKGTLHLRGMLADYDREPALQAFNIMWYRMFNRYEHAIEPGFCRTWEHMRDILVDKSKRGEKLFTCAHMLCGNFKGRYENKLDAHLATTKRIFEERDIIADKCRNGNLQDTFEWLLAQKYFGIGRFIAYEIITDFRWCMGLLYRAKDILTWANIGPGCKRGLKRLDMALTQGSLQHLYALARMNLGSHITEHFPSVQGQGSWPPFELREIEHSLCEFDKYMRVKTGAGRPRQRYEGFYTHQKQNS